MPSDGLLPAQSQEEALSAVYVRAVAAAAGYVVATWEFDRDGVDIEIKAGGEMRPAIQVQLKATINLGAPTAGVFRYPLNVRNYNLLRLPTQTPRILVVLALPGKQIDWLSVTSEALMLRHCAYWVSLRGQPETENAAATTISIPEVQQFDPEALRMLMEKSRSGAIL